MAELHKLAQAMCSVDLADSNWTQDLPRLPVPDLWLTVSRYLASLKAVLAPTSVTSTDQLSEGEQVKMRQFKRTDQLVRQFMLHEGPQLQRDLKEYANKCQNWATEYWLQDMYLANPLPLPVNSNPFFMFPRQQFASSQEMLMFATRIIQFSVDFKYRIDQQALKQDYGSGHGKGKPLCMETYKNFFHSYRMPHEDTDRLLPQSRRSNHIVVASCNQFYILRLGQDPLDNPYQRDSSIMIDETSIFDQLLRIYRVSREHAKRNQQQQQQVTAKDDERTVCDIPKVGLFTTEYRKTWAKLHKKLSHCSNNNNNSGDSSLTANVGSLRQIEDCLFVMCLDSLVAGNSTNPTPFRLTATGASSSSIPAVANEEKSIDGETDVEAAKIILTGGGSHLFTANRWFDKFLQIIVGRDGICGINIEHSASEGITVLRFLEDFLDFIKLNPINLNNNKQRQQQVAEFTYSNTINSANTNITAESITSSAYVEPKSPSILLKESDKITPLVWILDDELREAISEAETKVNKLIDNFSLNIFRFTHFGRSFVKSQHLSPDAFIQLSLQYTFFKLHGFLVSTYESASLRQFRLGRVDNIRANTCEAYDWIQVMLKCRKEKQLKQTTASNHWRSAEESFIKAITKQVEILRYTIIGGGPDNHLLALKQLAQIRYDDELPELFTDDSYKEYLNFRLSTSQLPNESGITVGYGAVVPDGYGCSYNPCQDRIIFCISTFIDCPETSSSKFAQTLEESLLEMRDLCLGFGIKE